MNKTNYEETFDIKIVCYGALPKISGNSFLIIETNLFIKDDSRGIKSSILFKNIYANANALYK